MWTLCALLSALMSTASAQPVPVSDPACIDDQGQVIPCRGSASAPQPQAPAPQITLPATIIASVCLNIAPGESMCLNETSAQLSRRMASSMVSSILEDAVFQQVTVMYPTVSYGFVGRMLLLTERRVIRMVQLTLEQDLRRLRRFDWDSEEQRAAQLAIIEADTAAIRAWRRAALAEARAGSNWSTNDNIYWTFDRGPAYQQLEDALQGKQWYH